MPVTREELSAAVDYIGGLPPEQRKRAAFAFFNSKVANPDWVAKAPVEEKERAWVNFQQSVFGGVIPGASDLESSSTLRRTVGDTAVAAAKGIVGLPQAVVGLADIPTGGRVGKFIEEHTPVQFKQTQDFLEGLYSPELRQQKAEVAQAEGVLPTIAAAVQRPATIWTSAVESAPSMLGGAAMGRAALGAIPGLTARLGTQAAGTLTAGAGEGLFTAGSNVESIREQSPTGLITPKQAGIGLASGALTGAIGWGMGKFLPGTDVDVLLAVGKKAAVGAASDAEKAVAKGLLRRVAESSGKEGLEEFLQSYQEAVAENLSMERQWDKGAANAAAQGALAGMLMGLPGGVAKPAIDLPSSKQPSDLTGGGDVDAETRRAASASAMAGLDPNAAAGRPAAPPAPVDTTPFAASPGEIDRALNEGMAQPIEFAPGAIDQALQAIPIPRTPQEQEAAVTGMAAQQAPWILQEPVSVRPEQPVIGDADIEGMLATIDREVPAGLAPEAPSFPMAPTESPVYQRAYQDAVARGAAPALATQLAQEAMAEEQAAVEGILQRWSAGEALTPEERSRAMDFMLRQNPASVPTQESAPEPGGTSAIDLPRTGLPVAPRVMDRPAPGWLVDETRQEIVDEQRRPEVKAQVQARIVEKARALGTPEAEIQAMLEGPDVEALVDAAMGRKSEAAEEPKVSVTQAIPLSKKGLPVKPKVKTAPLPKWLAEEMRQEITLEKARPAARDRVLERIRQKAVALGIPPAKMQEFFEGPEIEALVDAELGIRPKGGEVNGVQGQGQREGQGKGQALLTTPAAGTTPAVTPPKRAYAGKPAPSWRSWLEEQGENPEGLDWESPETAQRIDQYVSEVQAWREANPEAAAGRDLEGESLSEAEALDLMIRELQSAKDAGGVIDSQAVDNPVGEGKFQTEGGSLYPSWFRGMTHTGSKKLMGVDQAIKALQARQRGKMVQTQQNVSQTLLDRYMRWHDDAMANSPQVFDGIDLSVGDTMTIGGIRFEVADTQGADFVLLGENGAVQYIGMFDGEIEVDRGSYKRAASEDPAVPAPPAPAGKSYGARMRQKARAVAGPAIMERAREQIRQRKAAEGGPSIVAEMAANESTVPALQEAEAALRQALFEGKQEATVPKAPVLAKLMQMAVANPGNLRLGGAVSVEGRGRGNRVFRLERPYGTLVFDEAARTLRVEPKAKRKSVDDMLREDQGGVQPDMLGGKDVPASRPRQKAASDLPIFGGGTESSPAEKIRREKEAKERQQGMDFSESKKAGEVGVKMAAENAALAKMKDLVNNDPAGVMVNELLQNSIDAYREGSAKGQHPNLEVVSRAYEEYPENAPEDWRGEEQYSEGAPHNYTLFSVKDGGKGMTLKEFLSLYRSIGKKGKSGTDTSGGYGQANAAFMLVPKLWYLKTVSKGKVVEAWGNGDVIRDAKGKNVGIRYEERDARSWENNGTEFKSWLYNNTEKAERANTYAVETWSLNDKIRKYLSRLATPATIKTDLNWTEDTVEVKTLADRNQVYDPINVSFDGNEATVYFIERNPDTEQASQHWMTKQWTVPVRAYNKGIFLQKIDEDKFEFETLPDAPNFTIHIDFTRTTETSSILYPFLQNREGVSSKAAEKIKEVINERLSDLAADLKKANRDKIQQILDASPTVAGYKVLLPFVADDQVAKAKAILDEHLPVFERIGAIFKSFQGLLADVGEPDIQLAVTMDPKVHGFRANQLSTGHALYAINPISMDAKLLLHPAYETALAAGADPNFMRASNMVHTLVHEYVHNLVQNHSEDFTISLGVIYGKLTHTDLAAIEEMAYDFFAEYGAEAEAVSKRLIDEVQEDSSNRLRNLGFLKSAPPKGGTDAQASQQAGGPAGVRSTARQVEGGREGLPPGAPGVQPPAATRRAGGEGSAAVEGVGEAGAGVGGEVAESAFSVGSPISPESIRARLRLDKPVKGPTGASIVAYEWRSMLTEEWSDRKQDVVVRRVSDWNQSDRSAGTGREIVHVFYVQHPDGRLTVEGINSAQKILGINTGRLTTIAKAEQLAQQYRQKQDELTLKEVERGAKPTKAEAARAYRQANWSAMRTEAENDAIFNRSVVYEKDGKFLRTQPNTDKTRLMEENGWAQVGATSAMATGAQRGNPLNKTAVRRIQTAIDRALAGLAVKLNVVDEINPEFVPGAEKAYAAHGGKGTPAGVTTTYRGLPNGTRTIISLAMAGGATEQTGYHELFEAGRQLNLFSEADQRLLDQRYPKAGTKAASEVQADAFGDWVMGKIRPAPVVQRIFRGIQNVLERVRNALNGLGYRTAEDVFRDLYGGNLTPQGPGGGPGATSSFSLASNPAATPAQKNTRVGIREHLNGIIETLDAYTGSGLRSLPNVKDYLRRRYLALGALGMIRSETKKWYQMFRNATAEERKEIFRYLTTKDAVLGLPEGKLKQDAERAKRMVEEIGDRLVAAGLLPEEAMEAHRGEYLPRFYLQFLLGEKNFTAAGNGKALDMSYSKPRDWAKSEEELIARGVIEDPAYLVARAYSIPMRDMAILSWLQEIARHAEWVIPGTLVEWSWEENPGWQLGPWRYHVNGDGTFNLTKKARKVVRANVDKVAAGNLEQVLGDDRLAKAVAAGKGKPETRKTGTNDKGHPVFAGTGYTKLGSGLSYRKNDDGTFDLKITRTMEVPVQEDNVDDAALPKVVGKKRAEAMIEHRDNGLRRVASMSPDDWNKGKGRRYGLGRQLTGQPKLINSKLVTPYWLAQERDRIRLQANDYQKDDPAHTKALRIADRMDAIVKEYEAQGGYDEKNMPDEYTMMPKGKKYGPLAGMIVRKEIANDLVGTLRVTIGEESWLDKLGQKGQRLNQIWKWSKTAASIPGQIRNSVSNFIMLGMSGVPWHRLLSPNVNENLVLRAIREIKNDGRYWAVARRYGTTEATFSNIELGRIEEDLLDMLNRTTGGNPILRAQLIFNKVYEKTGDVYQLIEAIGKVVKIIDAQERLKMNDADAAMEAHHWLFDYSQVAKTVKQLRQMPLGMPFLTYSVKVLPRILDGIVNHPQQTLPLMGLAMALPYLIASSLDVDEEEYEKLMKALPEWIQTRGHVYLLPFKDDAGRWQVVDIGYFFPWTVWRDVFASGIRGVKNQDISEAGRMLSDIGFMGAPLFDIIAALKTGVDPFTQRPIVDKYAPPGEKLEKVLGYAWNLAMPNWLGIQGRGFTGKMWDAAVGTKTMDGLERASFGQALSSLAGVNVYGYDAIATRERNLTARQRAMQDVEKAMRRRLSDPNLSPEEQQEVADYYTQRLIDMAEQLSAYAEASASTLL